MSFLAPVSYLHVHFNVSCLSLLVSSDSCAHSSVTEVHANSGTQLLWTSPGSNVDLHRRNEAFLTLTAAGSRSISGRCTREYKEKIYLGPQASGLGGLPSFHICSKSLYCSKNTLLTKTHLLLFICNRNRLRRINYLSTECQQRLKNYVQC